MIGGYSALAPVYDKLNSDIDYGRWADFIEECFSRYLKEKPELVLDLGCGTGSMTLELADRGYDMTGLDISPDMLTQAYSRVANEGKFGILFLEGDMCDFELYGTVGAVVCCLDGINHLQSEDDVLRCFKTVHNYTDPDGLFIFDVNTPHKFKNVYADNDYVLEDKGAVCVWQNRLSEDAMQCDFHLSVFERCRDGRYKRTNGVQTEYCYTEETLKKLLCEAGFEVLGFFGGVNFEELQSDTQRWHIAARVKK